MRADGECHITSKQEVLKELDVEKYVDLSFSLQKVILLGLCIPNVYINIILNEKVEILFFFDLNDIGGDLDKLNKWAYSFSREYNLNKFICRVDANDDDDPYFFEFDWYNVDK